MSDRGWIVLSCQGCGMNIPIIDGIYHFISNRGSLSGVDYSFPNWVDKEREREKEYELQFGFDDNWLLSLPFPQHETETTFQKKGGALGRNFFELFSLLNLSGEERVLDLAAGCCWTSNEFARIGCHVISTDIRTIKYHGLRSAEVYLAQGTRKIVRLCWAFGTIPFADGSFDLVFCQNAFQYVKDLSLMLTEIRRVLKPGGRFVLAWTGVQAPLKSKKWGPGYTLNEYLRNVRGHGFLCAIYPPLSLFTDYAEEAAKTHFGTRFSTHFSLVWKRSAAFRKLAIRCYPWLDGLLGLPFNMFALRVS